MSTALSVRITGEQVQVGNVAIRFHRTLRIPDDSKEYPLPPSLGAFPLRRVEDYAKKVPATWREHGGVFLPMYQREAMWLSFSGANWRPNALKVAIGKVNALSGKPWSELLVKGRGEDEQDYMIVPEQPWLDGINAGDGFIKQFVAMPLGMGYTVEGQVTGEEKFGGVQLCVFDPKTGKFPDTPPPPSPLRSRRAGTQLHNYASLNSSYSGQSFGSHGLIGSDVVSAAAGSLDSSLVGQEMGLAAGGRMRQKIYPDRHGIETWDQGNYARLYVHLVNSAMWTQITGEAMPSTPVSVQVYAQHGYPWFDLYDEAKGDVGASDVLSGVKSVKEMDAEKGFTGQQDDSSVEVPPEVVAKYEVAESGVVVKDGAW